MARTQHIVLLATVYVVAACAPVLGIEQATHDPALDQKVTRESGAPRSLCDEYCDTIAQNCAGPVEQYRSKQTCLNFCQKLEQGNRDDNAGNTAGCRLHYAQAAAIAGEVELNCSAAGPGGNQICGTNCDALCKIAIPTCDSEVNKPFASQLACRTVCNTLPDLGMYDDSIETGNSVQCRLYHLSAAQTDPALHCRHVAGLGACFAPRDGGP